MRTQWENFQAAAGCLFVGVLLLEGAFTGLMCAHAWHYTGFETALLVLLCMLSVPLLFFLGALVVAVATPSGRIAIRRLRQQHAQDTHGDVPAWARLGEDGPRLQRDEKGDYHERP